MYRAAARAAAVAIGGGSYYELSHKPSEACGIVGVVGGDGDAKDVANGAGINAASTRVASASGVAAR